ncbi:hypothetical protein BA1DRAFT_00895 [Photorhabdus aegyptia]|uniref:Uncharacterized protein n=1 Tax=Photorhabdus aegyptia TaxID=2805098 RepID=A0A022PLV4_9GAMM|nr:hypothetical protein BA1DRAFT_00895 [Photorhabdus aegyptia]
MHLDVLIERTFRTKQGPESIWNHIANSHIVQVILFIKANLSTGNPSSSP